MSVKVDATIRAAERLLVSLFRSRFAVSATYYKYLDTTRDTEAKRNRTNYTEHVVLALDTRKNITWQTDSGATFGVADIDFLLLASQCPEGMTVRDQIEISGNRYQVDPVRPYLDVAFGITVKGLK
jgi:hypothetical protein